jgi:hypothetical protein
VDAFGVAADAFVVNRVSEMLKETFCEWRNVRAESVVNPSAFLAGPDKASVAQKSQVSGKVDCVVSRASHTKLVVTQRRNHPQACRVCQCLGKCDGGFHISVHTDMFWRCQWKRNAASVIGAQEAAFGRRFRLSAGNDAKMSTTVDRM